MSNDPNYTGRHGEPMASGNATLAAGVIIFLSSMTALVYMEANGHGTTQLMLLAGPVVAALLVNGHVTRLTDKQNHKLDTVIQQTNGVLDQRIRTQTLAALHDLGTEPQEPPTSGPSSSTLPPEFYRDPV